MGIGFALSVTRRGKWIPWAKNTALKTHQNKEKHKQQHVTKFIDNKTL
jgi:hypothetical protein